MHQNLVAQSSETMEQSGQQHWPLIRVVLVVSRDCLLLLRNMLSSKKQVDQVILFDMKYYVNLQTLYQKNMDL